MRALYAFLIGIALLWAMPRNAQAQLFVTQMPFYPAVYTGKVSVYDPDTGALIKDDFTASLNQPVAMALSEDGNALFVSNANGDVPNFGYVSKIDAKTGAVIDYKFISHVYGLGGLTVDGNFLYVVSHAGVPREGVVTYYDATTGQRFHDLLTGLDGALGLAADRAVGNIFVSLALSGSVLCSHDLSGVTKYIIPGLLFPQGVAVDFAKLYVTNGDGTIRDFRITDGRPIKRPFISGLGLPIALAVPEQPRVIFVLYHDNEHADYRVGKYYSETGAVIKKDFITGLHYALAIAAK